MTKIDYENVGKDVKECLYSFNDKFSKLERKKDELDSQFLKRIVNNRKRCLNKLTNDKHL